MVDSITPTPERVAVAAAMRVGIVSNCDLRIQSGIAVIGKTADKSRKDKRGKKTSSNRPSFLRVSSILARFFSFRYEIRPDREVY